MLQVGNHLEYRGVLATIIAIESSSFVFKINDELKIVTSKDLMSDMESGLVTSYIPSIKTTPSMTPSPLVTDKDKDKANRFEDYLTALDSETYPNSLKIRKRVITTIATKRGETGKNVPSPATLYTWYKKFISEKVDRNIAAMVNSKAKKRGRKASPEAMDLFFEIIDKHYLNLNVKGALNTAQCFKIFSNQWDKFKNEFSKVESAELYGIGRTVFYELVEKIDPVEVCSAREGVAVANRKYRNVTRSFSAIRPLERVQIDALHLNLGLTNEDDSYVGMPVIFFAIDVFTRAILSYVISYAMQRREDLPSAIDVVKSLIQVKQKPEHTKFDWPIHGKPEYLQHDSGVFSSKQFSAFLQNAQITPLKNPAKRPWFNAYIERFNRTFRTDCAQKIPGYAGKRLEDSKDTVNIKASAYVRVSEFKQIVEAFILDQYHQTPHRGLSGKSPMQMCEEYKSLISIPNPEYLARLNRFNGVEFEATIQAHKGIQKNNLFYNDNDRKLQKLYFKLRGHKSKNNKPKVRAFYSHLDISQITVYDKFTNENITIPCVSIKEPISLAEYKAKHTQAPKSNNTANTMGPIIAGINKRMQETTATKLLNNVKRAKTKAERETEKIHSDITTEELDKLIKNNAAGINDSSPVLTKRAETDEIKTKKQPIIRKKKTKAIKV